MKRFLITLLLASSVAGCGFTETGDRLRERVKQEGAQFYDQALINSEFVLCSAASIGSIKRRYGKSKETADAYRALCNGSSDVDVLPEPEPLPQTP